MGPDTKRMTRQLAKILIVDDRPENLFSLEQGLKSVNAQIFTAESGNDALALMLHHDFSLAILDVQMPEIDGFELAMIMRENEKTSMIPIIFVTAINKEEQHLYKGYATGAVDYIFKPLNIEVLKSKVRVFLKLAQQKKMLEDRNDQIHQAMTELKKANKKILAQQKSVIEEERLQVLLEMSGASVHELNQPMTVLLGTIELAQSCQNNAKSIGKYLSRIKETSEDIVEVIRKIQRIQYDNAQPLSCQVDGVAFTRPLHILYIEDSEDDFNRVKEILSPEDNITFSHGKTIAEGFTVIRQQDRPRIDLIFLDFILRDETGFDFLAQLKKEGVEIPIVIITGQDDELVAAQLIQAGAYEYLPKSRITHELLSRVIHQAMEKQQLNMDLKRMQARLIETSTKDRLTGLYNRHYFLDSFAAEVARAIRYKTHLALLIIDVDHFKIINDTWGHQVGDEVLVTIAQEFSSLSRKNDLVSRYGGEEFTILLPAITAGAAQKVGEKMRQAIAEIDFSHIQVEMRVTISVGVGTGVGVETGLKIEERISTATDSVQTLIAAADKALYRAKKKGRNRVEI